MKGATVGLRMRGKRKAEAESLLDATGVIHWVAGEGHVKSATWEGCEYSGYCRTCFDCRSALSFLMCAVQCDGNILSTFS